MGIKSVKIVTCDICGQECGEYDRCIETIVNYGDGRDVGPAKVFGKISFNQPYGCSAGLVCKQCKIKYLTQYLKEIS